jgi:hypothetical protein
MARRRVMPGGSLEAENAKLKRIVAEQMLPGS